MCSKSSFIQSLLTLIHRPTSSAEEETAHLTISISRPDLRFRVLDSLKNQGLFFINLDTGEYIDGLIDLPSIGLTHTPPRDETEIVWPTLGFLELNQPKKTEPEDDYFELDAVLFFDYDGPECKTGLLETDLAYLFFLKIWNDLELCFWEPIITKVVDDLTLKTGDYSHPLVKFIISTSFIPNNRSKQNRLSLPKKQSECAETDVVSSRLIVSESEDCEGRQRPQPRY